MRVIYNGVDLMPIETKDYYREAVYDDTMTDYLYTKVSIHVTALVNGQSELVNGPPMSYKFNGGITTPVTGPTRPFPAARSPDASLTVTPTVGIDRGRFNKPTRNIVLSSAKPFTTHKAIRHRLETPQGQLYVFSGPGMETGNPVAGTTAPPPNPDDIDLISPTAGRPCDCKNGPFPKLLGVTMASGDANTLVVDWACETYVNEAQENNVSPSGGLLSNRFSQVHSVDDDGYTTLTTHGVAIFRTDFIYGVGINPDSDRAVLFMPIPQGFRRVIDYVEARPDVTGLEYEYHDTQVPVNFVAGPYARASQIAAVHRQAVSADVDVVNGVLSAYGTVTGSLLNTKLLAERGKRRGRRPAWKPSIFERGTSTEGR